MKKQTILKRALAIKAIDALRAASSDKRITVGEAMAVVSEAVGIDDISRNIAKSLAKDAGIELLVRRSPGRDSGGGANRSRDIIVRAVLELYNQLGVQPSGEFSALVSKRKLPESE